MVNKGGFSFVAMLVINPVVILFYQNCSMAPVSLAKNNRPPVAISRSVASEAKPVTAVIKQNDCDSSKKEFPRQE